MLYIFYFSAKSDTYIRYFPHDVIYTIVDQKSSFVIICLKDAPSLAFWKLLKVICINKLFL